MKMTELISRVLDNLERLEDKRMADYPLMSSVWQPLTLILAYVAFIKYIGPKLMKNRPAYKLDGAIRVYNVLQVACNAFVFAKALTHFGRMRVHCVPWDGSNTSESLDILNLTYYYMLLKFVDFFDTVFFVLRKKHAQMTFLHVYHHIMMAITAWLSNKYTPGGLSYFPILMNSFVHCIMYYYYYSANRTGSKNIWWKKYITVVQLVQNTFGSYVSFAHTFNPYCSYSKLMAFWYAVNALTLFYLFMEFYVKSYLKNSRAKN